MSESDKARSGKFLNHEISTKQTNEMIGLARGLIADGHLNDAEIEFLHRWLVASSTIRSHPIFGSLLDRIRDIYEDGFVDEDERVSLSETIQAICASDFELGELFKSSTLPLDDPAPNVDFVGRSFCLTGTFVYGKRSQCEGQIKSLGGLVHAAPKRDTDFLVIGTYATDSWISSTFGRKIETGIDLRERGFPIAIVSEHHWRMFF